jgi:hypothetical protein
MLGVSSFALIVCKKLLLAEPLKNKFNFSSYYNYIITTPLPSWNCNMKIKSNNYYFFLKIVINLYLYKCS